MINQNRRKFLKTSLLCGGFFFLGRILGSITSGKFGSGEDHSLFKNSKEDENKVVYYDNKGHKVLVVEK
jgi:hypothetical protein